jgi:hypothetical protein
MSLTNREDCHPGQPAKLQDPIKKIVKAKVSGGFGKALP